MDLMQLGWSMFVIGALSFAVSGIIAFVHWIHIPRYGETMAAFNERLRMKYAGKLLRVAGSTLAIGSVGLLLIAVLVKERQPYELAYDVRTDGIVVVPRGAAVITPEEEGSRRLNELEANLKILWGERQELSAAVKKSPLARKLAKCQKLVRKLQGQRAAQPNFALPIPPRPARIAFDEGLSRGDPGGSE